MIQRRLACGRSSPNSSPIIPSPGKRDSIASRMNASASRSAVVTNDESDFVSTSKRPWKYLSVILPASSAKPEAISSRSRVDSPAIAPSGYVELRRHAQVVRRVERGVGGVRLVEREPGLKDAGAVPEHVVEAAGRRRIERVYGRRPGLLRLAPVGGLVSGDEAPLHQADGWLPFVGVEVADDHDGRGAPPRVYPIQQPLRLGEPDVGGRRRPVEGGVVEVQRSA